MNSLDSSFMMLMVLWWSINVTTVWLNAKKWHIKVLLGGTLLYVAQLLTVVMFIFIIFVLPEKTNFEINHEFWVLLLFLDLVGCWLLGLWLGKLALKICLKNKGEEKYIAPPFDTAFGGTVVSTLMFLLCLLLIN